MHSFSRGVVQMRYSEKGKLLTEETDLSGAFFFAYSLVDVYLAPGLAVSKAVFSAPLDLCNQWPTPGFFFCHHRGAKCDFSRRHVECFHSTILNAQE